MISFIKYFFILILLAAGALAGAYFYVEGKLVSIDNSLLKAGNEIYTVAPGATPQSVVEDLVSEPEDRIYYRLWFKLHPEFSSRLPDHIHTDFSVCQSHSPENWG